MEIIIVYNINIGHYYYCCINDGCTRSSVVLLWCVQFSFYILTLLLLLLCIMYYYYCVVLLLFIIIIVSSSSLLPFVASSFFFSACLRTLEHTDPQWNERLYCWHCITPTRILYDILADLSTTYCSKTTPQSISKKSSTEDYEKAVALFPGEDKSKGNSVCFCNLRLWRPHTVIQWRWLSICRWWHDWSNWYNVRK